MAGRPCLDTVSGASARSERMQLLGVGLAGPGLGSATDKPFELHQMVGRLSQHHLWVWLRLGIGILWRQRRGLRRGGRWLRDVLCNDLNLPGCPVLCPLWPALPLGCRWFRCRWFRCNRRLWGHRLGRCLLPRCSVLRSCGPSLFLGLGLWSRGFCRGFWYGFWHGLRWCLRNNVHFLFVHKKINR